MSLRSLLYPISSWLGVHRVLPLRRLAFLVGVLLLKLPSIVRRGGAGRHLLQDEACALYNATAQVRAGAWTENGTYRAFPPFLWNSGYLSRGMFLLGRGLEEEFQRQRNVSRCMEIDRRCEKGTGTNALEFSSFSLKVR